MAWVKINIKVDNEVISAFKKDNQIQMPNMLEIGDSINIDNKNYAVLSSSVNYRDDILIINLADASKPKKEKKSDGKSTKG